MGYQALLFCSDEKLVRVVSQVFSELDFEIDPVTEPFGAVKKLMAHHFDAIVVDCENEQNSALLFKSARNSTFNQGSLAIALVEGQAGVAKAYRIGANLVLTKPINVEQAKGTLRVARGLLRKGSDATTSVGHAAAAAAGVGAAPAVQSTPAPMPAEETIAPPPVHEQPAFEAPLPAVAAFAKIQERLSSAPVQDWSSLSTEVPVAPAPPAAPKTVPVVVPKEASTKTEAPKTTTAPVIGKSQAAGAAPAKEGAIAEKKAAVKEKDLVEVESATRSTKNSSTGAVSDGLLFAALTDQGAKASGGSNKIAIAAVAVLVLAGISYFAWSRHGERRRSDEPLTQISQPVSTSAQNKSETVSEVPSAAAPAPARSTTPPERVSTTTTAPSAKMSAPDTFQTSAAAPSTTHIVLHSEADGKASVPAPLMVKSTVTSKSKTGEDASAPLPSPLAVGAGSETGLNAVLLPASSNVSKPTLARIKVSQGVSQGLVIKRVQPKYPANALSARIQGAVQIEATINREGVVVNPKVLSGEATLAAAALEAVRQWRYKPYYLDGEPVEIQTQITVNFKSH